MWVTQPYFWEDTHKIGFTPSRTSNLAFDTDSEPHGPLQLRYDALAKTQGAQLPCLSPFPPRTQRSECGGLSSGDWGQRKEIGSVRGSVPGAVMGSREGSANTSTGLLNRFLCSLGYLMPAACINGRQGLILIPKGRG